MNPKYELAILMIALGMWDEEGLISYEKIRSEFTIIDVIFIESVLDSLSGEGGDGSAIEETFARVKELIVQIKNQA